MPNESFPQVTALKKLRFAILKTIEQLNKVPDGFNSNIIWNVAHLIASQQNLCYMKAGQKALSRTFISSIISTTTYPG